MTRNRGSWNNLLVNRGYFFSTSLYLLLFSRSVVSDSLRPHGLKHARPSWPSPTLRAYSNSCPSGQRCHPTISSSVVPFSSCLQSFPALGSFQMSTLLHIRWPKDWSFSFSISPSNEYSGLISFRINWFDLLGVQGTLKSLLQHHSSKASVLWCSAFFMVQLSHLYMTTGKTIALTIWPFVGKVMPLVFNTLSVFIMAFLPRSKQFYKILKKKKRERERNSKRISKFCQTLLWNLGFWLFPVLSSIEFERLGIQRGKMGVTSFKVKVHRWRGLI